MARGWTTIALKDELAARIDAFLTSEGVSLGYTSRADFVADAARRLLEQRKKEFGEASTARTRREEVLDAIRATAPKAGTGKFLEAALSKSVARHHLSILKRAQLLALAKDLDAELFGPDGPLVVIETKPGADPSAADAA